LHDAVRFADEKLVCELMSACPSLARFPGDGTSALYLAISLGHDRIVDLLHSKDPELSYSGPAGQNALHAASLHGRGMYVCHKFFSICTYISWGLFLHFLSVKRTPSKSN
jgi:hypothetical protein